MKTTSNEAKIANKLNRQFSNRQPLEAIVTDLIYVREETLCRISYPLTSVHYFHTD